jgi:8-oxo-dGTP diphosphatase
MDEFKGRARYPISVDSVIFRLAEGDLKIALIERKNPPFMGMWAVPGGFMEGDETVEETALRELKEETGIEKVYLEQFHVFSKRGRDPRGPTLTIALFALIRSDQCKLVATGDASAAKWWPAYALPSLAFDHDQVCAKALDALRAALKTRPLAFELLPKAFTLYQLQDLYEQVFGISIDKRNFRKKVQKMDFICASGKKTEGGRHRPAMLYHYNAKRYVKFANENLF